jgi:isoleucyl-tRNA synthetase
MSKSVGNVIAPQDVIKESGAEIIRLWVAMSEFTEELRVSREILTRVVDVYRKLRNTCRILVANLYDFDPAVDAVPLDRLDAVDRFALARYGEAAQRMLRAYDEYDFSTVAQTLNTLMTVDLSAFYVDVSKDRLYTFGAASPSRRAAQTAMFTMVDGLARLVAPILPVTAEQLWRALPGSRAESVHLEEFPAEPALRELLDEPLVAEWQRLLAIRADVNGQIEEKRAAKLFGTSLGAEVRLTASGDDLALLRKYEAQLPMLFIVSAASVAEGAGELAVTVSKADGVKCERCWRIVAAVSSEGEREGLCDRCADALSAPVAS